MPKKTEMLDALKQIFVTEFEEQIESLESGLMKLEKNPGDDALVGEIFRYSHNIKGSSAAVGFTAITGLSHAAETLMSSVKNHVVKCSEEIIAVLFRFVDVLKAASDLIKKGQSDDARIVQETEFIKTFTANLLAGHRTAPPAPEPPPPPSQPAPPPLPLESAAPSPPEAPGETQAEEFIKISARKVDRLIELFGEQVILQSTVDHAMENMESDRERAKRSLTELRKITRSLQLGVVTLRMISVKPLVKRLERSVRDAAKITGKDIRFQIMGDNIEVDKTILDVIANPLTHLVRNAVDHGIETSDTRERQGKPKHGTINLVFRRSGGAIDIVVEDDGGGLNRDRILAKAVKLGLAQADRSYSDAEINRFIFKNGFSTNETANEISGRGVGMDVVQKTVEDLKGAIFIDSTPGAGSKFTCRLPLSLDMFNGTIVKLADERYVFSNSEYKETVNIDLDRIENVGQDDTFIRIGERVIKIIDLRRVLVPVLHATTQRKKDEGSKRKRLPALVLELRGVEFGFMVEELLAQEQIVLKRISDRLGRTSGAIGCTILGDGQVALILSLAKILEHRFGMVA